MARDSLEFIITDIILSASPQDVPDLNVERVLEEYLKFKQETVKVERCQKISEILEAVISKAQMNELDTLQNKTLHCIARHLDDSARGLNTATFAKKSAEQHACDYTTETLEALEVMAKLWQLAAQYLLLIPSGELTDEHKTSARSYFIWSATCNLVIHRKMSAPDRRGEGAKKRLQARSKLWCPKYANVQNAKLLTLFQMMTLMHT